MTPEDLQTLYKTVFATNDGERVVKDLAARFHIHGSTFSTDPTETAYREGQRTVVLFLHAMLQDKSPKEQIVDE